MKYGHFSTDGTEYVITDPNTPRPWVNYLTNREYCAIMSQTAGGYSFYKDCRAHRITRWQPDGWHFNRPGKYLYVKDVTKKNGKSDVWSMTYQPVRAPYGSYECRHGLGYTTITQKKNNITQEVTYFVPENDTCEVWIVKVENTGQTSRELEIYPYIEWLIGDYHEELRYRNIMNLYNRVWFDKKKKAILAKKTATWKGTGIEHFPYTLFFASSLPAAGYVTRKDAFLGKYNTEEKPEMLYGRFENVELSSGEDSVAVLKHRVKLNPGESKTFTVTLGQAAEDTETRLISKYTNVARAEKELQNVKNSWREKICDNIVVSTPDKDFDRMANVWMKYQLYVCNLWSRSPSFYHEGAGGRGYRDSCQDAEGMVSINPQLTKRRILQVAALIRRDGTSAPGWNVITGPAGHRPNKDHQIWLTMTVSAYVKETGDVKILSEKVPYLKDKWLGGWHTDLKHKGGPAVDGVGTLLEHLEKNLNFCYNDTGERGLPLIGHADWNDAIDSAGIKLKGESVWLAMALVRSLKTLVGIMDLIGNKKKSAEYIRKADEMAKRINKCWDGGWYVRGFTDGGDVYGSKKNKEGRIHLNAQSWSILAGVADDKKTKEMIKNVDKYIDGEHGYALFNPAYSTFDKSLGRITMFSEGTKENAAVFCHAATFYIVALLSQGEGDRAYNAMKKIMPNAQEDYDLYKTEPYVYAEYLVGPEHPYLYGEGAFTWITGTAGWSFMAATEHLLGAKRDYEGLRVDPCLPRAWKKCSITRPFRGTTYHIEILNPKAVQSGVKEVYVDGVKIKGNLIKPSAKKQKESYVKVVMG